MCTPRLCIKVIYSTPINRAITVDDKQREVSRARKFHILCHIFYSCILLI